MLSGVSPYLSGVKSTREIAAAGARFRAGRGRFRAGAWCAVFGALAGCKENLSPHSLGVLGPDTSGPLVQLAPAHDTAVDSIGTLLVHVGASDPSGVKQVVFSLLPPKYTISPLAPNDTTFDVYFPIALALYKHTTFKYFVRSSDYLDHETVTDTVTVTVR